MTTIVVKNGAEAQSGHWLTCGIHEPRLGRAARLKPNIHWATAADLPEKLTVVPSLCLAIEKETGTSVSGSSPCSSKRPLRTLSVSFASARFSNFQTGLPE